MYRIDSRQIETDPSNKNQRNGFYAFVLIVYCPALLSGFTHISESTKGILFAIPLSCNFLNVRLNQLCSFL